MSDFTTFFKIVRLIISRHFVHTEQASAAPTTMPSPPGMSQPPKSNNPVPTSAAKPISKSRRSNKPNERVPKLVVISVQDGTLVDCSMEHKQKTITFKFDISDVNPIEVANDLVSPLDK